MQKRNGEIVKCSNCRVDFYQKRYKLLRNKNNFCSSACTWEYNTGKIRTSKTLNCGICGKEIVVMRSRLSRNKNNFCSKKCFWKHEEKSKIGEKYHWKGGRYLSRGYYLIYKKEHPNCNSDGYVLEHRLMVEGKIGRYLEKNEVVHHIDGNKKNNDISNLMLFKSNSEHIKHHQLIKKNKI
jgi:hypothetical protein